MSKKKSRRSESVTRNRSETDQEEEEQLAKKTKEEKKKDDQTPKKEEAKAKAKPYPSGKNKRTLKMDPNIKNSLNIGYLNIMGQSKLTIANRIKLNISLKLLILTFFIFKELSLKNLPLKHVTSSTTTFKSSLLTMSQDMVYAVLSTTVFQQQTKSFIPQEGFPLLM